MAINVSPVTWITDVRTEMSRILIGQEAFIDRLLIGLLTGGHLLIEGVPGLAKTLAAQSLATIVGARFGRVQFTPDLLPADLVGTEIYQPATGELTVRPGPIFTEILLADEINRAPAKVQSALLEAMQEQQVTIGHETRPLPSLFLVLATQNPIEHEGTYPLPEAQMDRFLMKLRLTYPSLEAERQILAERAVVRPRHAPQPVTDAVSILEQRAAIDAIHLDEKVTDYILQVTRATRAPKESGYGDLERWIELGVSPRGSLALAIASKAHAFLAQRDYVVPHDVKSVGHDVLRHRLMLSFEAEAEEVSTDDVLDQLFRMVPVP